MTGVPLRSRFRRGARLVGYLLVAACGVCAIVWPPESVRQATSPAYALTFVWCSLLVIGGGLSTYGTLARQWIGEYMGLPAICIALAAFGFAVLTAGRGTAALAGGALLLSFALLLLARWHEMAVLRREAVATRKAHRQ